MPSIFDAFDNRLDPENPQDALIMAQRAKYFAWQEKASQFAPDVSPDREHWEIEPVSICESLPIARRDLAASPAGSPLVEHIQNHLIEAYHRRGLYFPQDDIHAIADPDETDRFDERAGCRG